MKIAQVATSWLRVPPIDYGGAELIVNLITEELVRRNHEVVLFAPGNSITRAKLVSCVSEAPGLSSENTADINLRSRYYLTTLLPILLNQNYDIIHWHVSYDLLPFFVAQVSGKIPAVVTFHNSFKGTSDLFKINQGSYNISISKSFQKQIPINFCAVVHNGIDLKDYEFIEGDNSDDIVWIGRFSAIKGAHTAIKLANKIQKKLKLAGEKKNTGYFLKKIMPEVNKSSNIDYVGPLGIIKKNSFLGKAKFLVNPIEWEEPFGLVVPEANACGTPVIAYNRGAMSELIEDGKNGFLVEPDDFEGLQKAAQKIYAMSTEEYQKMRLFCRKHVEEKFTIEKMVDRYEKVYLNILNKNK